MVATRQVSVVSRSHRNRHLFPIGLQGCGPAHVGRAVEERSERLGRNTPDLHSAEREHVDREPGVELHSEATSEHRSGAGHDGGGADDLAGSGKPRGEFCSPYTAIRADRYWPKDSVPSKSFWSQSPVSMPNIRFVSTLRSRPLSDNYIPRTPMASRARLKSFSHASPHWIRISDGARVM